MEQLITQVCPQPSQGEVVSLSKQLNMRNYARRKGFSEIRAHHSQKEFLVSKLPTIMQHSLDLLEVKRTTLTSGVFGSIHIGHLSSLGIHVAAKKGRGSSLVVEGGVYQVLSGSQHFLHFFGI